MGVPFLLSKSSDPFFVFQKSKYFFFTGESVVVVVVVSKSNKLNCHTQKSLRRIELLSRGMGEGIRDRFDKILPYFLASAITRKSKFVKCLKFSYVSKF